MLAIIQAFMHDPDLVVMDEPTSGLDPLKQERFNEFVREERDRGLLSSSPHTSSRRCVGSATVSASSATATSSPWKTSRTCWAAAASASASRPPVGSTPGLRVRGGVLDLSLHGDSAHFTFAGDYDALVDHLDDLAVVDLTVDEPPLEDVFMHFYGESDSPATDREPEERHV